MAVWFAGRTKIKVGLCILAVVASLAAIIAARNNPALATSISATASDYCSNSGGGNNWSQEDLGQGAIGTSDNSELGIEIISVVSNNANPSLAKVGDTITVCFQSALALDDVGVLIAGQEAEAYPGDDRTTWTAEYTLRAGDAADYQPIPVMVTGSHDGIEETVCLDTETVTFFAEIAADDLRFFSDNDSPAIAVEGDTVFVTFNTAHPVQVNAGKIAGQAVEFSSLNDAGMEWTGAYTIPEGVFEPGTALDFSLVLNDEAGNPPVTLTDGDTADSVLYCLPVFIRSIDVVSSNPIGLVAICGDTITVTVEADMPVTISGARIAGVESEFTALDEEGCIWAGAYTITGDEQHLADNDFISYAFVATNESGGFLVVEQESSIRYIAPIAIQDLSIVSNNPEPDVAFIGDTVTVSVTTATSVTISGASIAGQSVEFESQGDGRVWSGTYTITGEEGLETEEPVYFQFTAADAYGNILPVDHTAITSPPVLYFAPIAVEELSIASNNANPRLAKDGDEITVTFITSKHINQISDAKIAGHPVNFTSQQIPGGDKVWTGKYTLANGDLADGEFVSFEFTAVRKKSFLRKTYTNTDLPPGRQVLYRGPIQVTSLSVSSDNPNSPLLAKDGDRVTVALTSEKDDAVVISALVAGQQVDFHKDEQGIWSGALTLANGMVDTDNTDIPFAVTLTDEAGNITVVTETQAGINVRYYAPIADAIAALDFCSDNEIATHYAKDGDTVTITLTATHPVSIENALIADRPVAFTSDDGLVWTGTYLLRDHDIPGYTDITFSFDITDAAGNAPVQKSHADAPAIRYFPPLEKAFTRMEFTSGNPNPAYAKIGDRVTLSFATSHPVMIRDMWIAGQAVTPVDLGGGMKWLAVYVVAGGDIEDNTDIPFHFTAWDAAGNTPLTRTHLELEPIRYQAPIVINNLAMVSNNAKAANLAKNGDVIEVTFNTTHPVSLSEVKIAGMEAEFSSDDGMNWTALYTVVNDHTADNEFVSLAFTASDCAGNAPVTADESMVVTNKVKYFAPITVSEMKIFSSNVNDHSRYAKDGDRITISFTTNHDVMLSGVRVANALIPAANVSKTKGSLAVGWTMTHTVKNGDLPDLAWIEFEFDMEDEAGNTLRTESKKTAGLNVIRYFAPLEAVTAISSNGTNPAYAKNGDTVTVSIEVNHQARFESGSIFARSVSVSGNNSSELSMSYSIRDAESSLSEGVIPFACTIVDQAGNRLSIQEANSPASQVIYDRTSPKIDLSNDFSGFINQEISYTLRYR
ncbi:MAG TPA: Ig-like domain repeat protein [Bacillota bacterium]|nr:Ig-like domain repeat protein [Bacillota bacterium]